MIGFTPDILVRGRTLARTRMVATVTVRRKTAEYRNPVTGKLEPTWTVIYDAGPCDLRVREPRPREVDASGQRYSAQEPVAAFPIDGDHAVEAALIRVDDVGTVDANPDDAGQVGMTFRVTGQHAKTLATARRLPVEVLSYA